MNSTIDTTFNSTLMKSLENSPLLNEKDKAWARVGSGLDIICGPDSYLKDIEDTMDTLVYLNACASDTNQDKCASDIGRMYYTLQLLRDAFREYKKIIEFK